MSCIIIPIPLNDNGNLMKILGTIGSEYTVTTKTFFTIMSYIYGQTPQISSLSSTTAQAIIVNGHEAICSQLIKNGYGNYSVTSQPYYNLVSKLFAEIASPRSHHVQPPSPTGSSFDQNSFDNYYSADDDDAGSTTGEPSAKRASHHKYCGQQCLQQCQKCKKHVLKKDDYSSNDIIFHAFHHIHAFHHTEMLRFQCLTCKLGWSTQPKDHKCKSPKVIDVIEPSNLPIAVATMARECFPKAIDALKEKNQWKF